jgi:hypothetical protein
MGAKHPIITTQSDCLSKEQIFQNREDSRKQLQSQKIYTSSRRKMVIEYFNSKNKFSMSPKTVSGLHTKLNDKPIIDLANRLVLDLFKQKDFNLNFYNSSNLVKGSNEYNFFKENSMESFELSAYKRSPERHRTTVDNTKLSLEKSASFMSTNSTSIRPKRPNYKNEIKSIDTSKMRNLRPQNYELKKDISFISEI